MKLEVCELSAEVERRMRENRVAADPDGGGVWGGVPPPQLTRGSGGASWAPLAGSAANELS